MVEGREAFNLLRTAMKTVLSVRKSDLPKVREFKGSRAEDAWLLVAWEGSTDDWWFRYFTIEMNAAIPFPPPSGS